MTSEHHPVIRKHFLMRLLDASHIPAYTREHEQIWPELQATLKSHGVSNYSIALHRPSLQLFGYAEITSEAQWAAIATTDVCKRWWAFMAPLMETNPDQSPKSEALEQVFYMA